ncbi:MAG: hypothetical protein WAO20_14475 [Acidobacteriota bacterium]
MTSPPSEGLEGFLESRVRAVARILDDIETDASNRQHLSDEVLAAIEDEAGALRSAVRTLEAALLHDAGFHPLRQGLERRLEQLGAEARRERVTRWQDLAALKRELRQWLREYEKALERTRLLGPQSTHYTRPGSP